MSSCGIHAVDRDRWSRARGAIVAIVLRQIGQQLANHAQAFGVVRRDEMRHAADACCASSAPPSFSLVTSSCVTVLITSGPVTNM